MRGTLTVALLGVLRDGKMEVVNQTPLTIARGSLASLLVLFLFLMSSAVGSCQLSCLFDDGNCVDAPVRASASARQVGAPSVGAATQALDGVGSPIHQIRSDSACDEDLCKDGSVTAMLPADRVALQDRANANVQWLAADAVWLVKWSAREDSRSKAESPPCAAVAVNPLSISLRI